MNQKINETCKNYLEIEILENINVFKSASKGPFGFLYTPIRQYDRPHEQDQIMMDQRIHKVSFLNLIALNSF